MIFLAGSRLLSFLFFESLIRSFDWKSPEEKFLASSLLRLHLVGKVGSSNSITILSGRPPPASSFRFRLVCIMFLPERQQSFSAKIAPFGLIVTYFLVCTSTEVAEESIYDRLSHESLPLLRLHGPTKTRTSSSRNDEKKNAAVDVVEKNACRVP